MFGLFKKTPVKVPSRRKCLPVDLAPSQARQWMNEFHRSTIITEPKGMKGDDYFNFVEKKR
jgi:hypothetical protein